MNSVNQSYAEVSHNSELPFGGYHLPAETYVHHGTLLMASRCKQCAFNPDIQIQKAPNQGCLTSVTPCPNVCMSETEWLDG